MTTAARTPHSPDRDRPEPQRPASDLRKAKEALVRQHILDVAERSFAQQGFGQTKMQTIARQAGVSLATLYQFYPGKQDLYRAVLIARDREMIAAVTGHPVMRTAGDLSTLRLLSLMQAQLLFQLSHPDYLKLILHEGHAWYHVAAQPTVDEQALWAQGLKLITMALEHGMQAGELIPAPPVDQARLLLALQQARLASWVADGMQEDHDSVLGRIQADFVRQFCRPERARQLLSEDGSRLLPEVLQEIQDLAG